MSNQLIDDGLAEANRRMQAEFEAGSAPWLYLSGRPRLQIIEFNPLSYKEYGLVANRAPRLDGMFRLRGLLYREVEDGVQIYSGVETGQEKYGFNMSDSPEGIAVVNTVIANLGITGLTLHTEQFQPS